MKTFCPSRICYNITMDKSKCFFCDKDATHYDVVVDNADYIVADVCFYHLSVSLNA